MMQWKKPERLVLANRRPAALDSADLVEQANALCAWRDDLIPRLRQAALAPCLRTKLAVIVEGFDMLVSMEAFVVTRKTQALATVMKNRAGL